MHDVFISYAAEDRETAGVVATYLTARGVRVWWDEAITPGANWAEKIESALKSAKCVIVLWSGASIASKWVKKEARYAEDRSVLVPALIQDVSIPFEFEHVQAARLASWTGEPDHPGAEALLAAVRAAVHSGGGSGSEPLPPSPRKSGPWPRRVAAAAAATCAAAWVLLGGYSMVLERAAGSLILGGALLTATLGLLWFYSPRVPQAAPGRRRAIWMKMTVEILLPFSAALLVVAVHAEQNKPRPTAWTPRDIAVGERFLETVHRQDVAAGYHMAAASVRATMSIGQLQDLVRRYMLQITAAPISRTFDKAVVVNGRLVIAYLAEFDNVSRAREFVTFAWEGDGWRPAAYDIWPVEWPVTGYLSNVVPEARAADIVRVLTATAPGERDSVAQSRFAGRYIPGATGWSLRLSGLRQRVAERTCHVMATEQDTGTPVMMWQVLDGCQLPADRAVSVFGRIRHATDRRIELEAVRVLGQ
jgi:hypothetical protein